MHRTTTPTRVQTRYQIAAVTADAVRILARSRAGLSAVLHALACRVAATGATSRPSAITCRAPERRRHAARPRFVCAAAALVVCVALPAGCSTHGPLRRPTHARAASVRASTSDAPPPPLFPQLAPLQRAEAQAWLVRDMGRRRAELIALGWLGRAYLAAPGLLALISPSAFDLSVYEDGRGVGALEQLAWETRGGGCECVLAETSVVPRGVPLRLRLTREPPGAAPGPAAWRSAELVAVGCDLTPEWPAGARPMSDDAARALCAELNAERAAKRLVVRAIVRAIFDEIEPLFAAPSSSAPELELCGPAVPFRPRPDLYAREGSSEKWLQRVSAYYFAHATLRDVRVAGSARDVRFTFYLDPAEPPNSLDPRRNVNPEVVCCKFASYPGHAQPFKQAPSSRSA